MNAEFQRRARRDKQTNKQTNKQKQLPSDQCKETEKNNRMGKTRVLFQKIRNTKGIFHVKMGTIKYRNGMDLTEAEDIKRSGKSKQKNCTKNIFTTQITTMV